MKGDPREKLIQTLRKNWKREMEIAHTYRQLADQESDPVKHKILLQLAAVEAQHADKWARKLRELGVEIKIPERKGLPSRFGDWLVRATGLGATLRRLEAVESRMMKMYETQESEFQDDDIKEILRDIRLDERRHAGKIRTLVQAAGPRQAMELFFQREKWHRSGHTWIGDVIYGVNDGLGAVFGIISGVAGFTDSSRLVLVSGLAGMMASALSMGAGAYLAAKSEREVFEAEISREREEIEEDPAHEIEELQLLYQLKGFSEEEARILTQRIQKDPDQFLQTMAQEELGLTESQFTNPWTAALSGSVSTAVGAFIPLIPFFFLNGAKAVVSAAIVSIVAHFAVGAAKSIVTVRSWWISGLEMTFVGIIEGAITYLLGLLGGQLMHYA